MDRLTTGRRHPRAGSVTVTELLSRQASRPHCTESSPTAPDDDITDTIPVVVHAAHRREPARAAQLAKLASLGVAGIVLCGAVAISTMMAHQRRDVGQQARPIVQITGEQALLPDKLDETMPEVPAPASGHESSQRDVEEEAPPSTSAPVSSMTPATDTDDTNASSGGAVTDGPADDLELVRDFYESLPDAPVTAFNMLSSDLLGMDLDEFLTSWSTVTKVDTVDVAQRADGVLATVRMRLADGGQLRVQQLLTVAESPRRIVGAQLLSAQRN